MPLSPELPMLRLYGCALEDAISSRLLQKCACATHNKRAVGFREQGRVGRIGSETGPRYSAYVYDFVHEI
jgi:hypothetical protein